MRVSEESDESGWERSTVCRSLAVCAVSAAKRCGRTLHELQPRRGMLSARDGRGAGVARRSEFCDFSGSLAWARSLITSAPRTRSPFVFTNIYCLLTKLNSKHASETSTTLTCVLVFDSQYAGHLSRQEEDYDAPLSSCHSVLHHHDVAPLSLDSSKQARA